CARGLRISATGPLGHNTLDLW
nr:immunoglobulin heavy chain junction region [Macaca mulatta]